MAMKNIFDVMQDIRSLIDVPEIRSQVDAIWPDSKPNNRNMVDIVIGCNSITNTQQQIGQGNVNIYVPPIVTRDGKGDNQFSPDYQKMNHLCKAIEPLIDNQYSDSFRTYVLNSGNIFRDTDGTWFCNIKFKYYSIQNI